MKLSKLITKKHCFKEKEDEYFINKGKFSLEAFYQIDLEVNSHLIIDFDYGDSLNAFLFKLNGLYYLCASTGGDEYRDYRSAIFELTQPIEETEKAIAKKYTNLVSQAIDIEAKVDDDEDEQREGVAFHIENMSNSEALIILSLSYYDEYYPHSYLFFNEELYKNALPFIEKRQLEKEITGTNKKSKNTKL